MMMTPEFSITENRFFKDLPRANASFLFEDLTQIQIPLFFLERSYHLFLR